MEMVSTGEDGRPTPGLQRVVDSDPAALAERLDAEHLTAAEEVERAVASGAGAAVDADTVEALRTLVHRIELAERVEARTRARSADSLAERLGEARTTAVAIHPSALRSSADAVVAARRDLDLARAALDGHRADHERRLAELEEIPAERRPDAHPGEASGPREADLAGGDASDPLGPTGRELDLDAQTDRVRDARRARSLVLGVVAVALGGGLVLIGATTLPAWLALLPTLAAALWGSTVLRRSVADEPWGEEGDHTESSSLLAEVAAATDQVFGARRADIARAEERSPELEARIRLAEEDLRVAERSWHELAGDDADPADVDEVVRRMDPQHQDAVVLAAQTATVRAAGVLLTRTLERWEEAWAAIGRPAPALEDAADAVAALTVGAPPVFVCSADAAVLAEDLAEALPSAAVIAVADGAARPDGAAQDDGAVAVDELS